MDESPDETPMIGTDKEMKELLGLYDVPAYARRGQDLEYALARLDARCRREREAMMEMVRVRLRQWAAASTGPEAALLVFRDRLDDLWIAAGAEPPRWSTTPASGWRLRSVARDLVASVDRFNRRWTRFLGDTNFDQLNGLIDRYNRYYMIEKECAMGSARLASRFFAAKPRVSIESLLATYPPLPVPEPRS